jgi:hypothetical protein
VDTVVITHPAAGGRHLKLPWARALYAVEVDATAPATPQAKEKRR